MVLAKDARPKPRDLAELIAADLREDPRVASAEIAGPGFINLRLEQSVYWHDVLHNVLEPASHTAAPIGGDAAPVNVEYVSANPTGPMHVGHGRGAVFGDALASLLAFTGFEVTREYYINDAGAQVDVLARSAFLRYREALGEDIGAIPEGLYPGDYLVPVGAGARGKIRARTADLPRRNGFRSCARRHRRHDGNDPRGSCAPCNPSRAFLLRALADRRARPTRSPPRSKNCGPGHLRGPPAAAQGPAAEDWEDREQTLFRATAFGDDVDRPLMKSDGSYTYFAADIAYHRDKIERGFTA
jgi:arginyl-tRNA synthetase